MQETGACRRQGMQEIGACRRQGHAGDRACRRQETGAITLCMHAACPTKGERQAGMVRKGGRGLIRGMEGAGGLAGNIEEESRACKAAAVAWIGHCLEHAVTEMCVCVRMCVSAMVCRLIIAQCFFVVCEQLTSMRVSRVCAPACVCIRVCVCVCVRT